MTEAFALLQGVLFTSEMQISHAIFESDALSVIQALTSGDLGGEVGRILHDIKSSSHSSVVIQFQVGMILFQVYHQKKKNCLS